LFLALPTRALTGHILILSAEFLAKPRVRSGEPEAGPTDDRLEIDRLDSLVVEPDADFPQRPVRARPSEGVINAIAALLKAVCE
jgi:hypothetical protein